MLIRLSTSAKPQLNGQQMSGRNPINIRLIFGSWKDKFCVCYKPPGNNDNDVWITRSSVTTDYKMTDKHRHYSPAQ